MAKFNTIQTSFVSGMVSKKFNGVTDLQLYREAVEELINMYPTSEGGARSREAFERAITTSLDLFYSVDSCTLIPYVDSTGGQFIFKLTFDHTTSELYTHIWKFINGSWVNEGLIYKATIIFDTKPNIDWCYVGDAIVVTTGLNVPWVIHRPPNIFNAFTISDLDRFVYESNPAATVTDLNKAMRAMTFPLVDKNTNPNFLLVATLVSGTAYKLTYKNAAGATLLNPWATDLITYITVTNSTYTTIFKTTGIITGAGSEEMGAELVYKTGTIGAPLTTTGEKPFYISAWDNINGYPKYCSFSNGRLALSSTNKFPSKTWFSKSDVIYRFHNLRLTEDASADVSGLGTNGDVLANSAFSVLNGGNTSSKISWIVSGPNGFYIGSYNGVDLLTSGSNGSLSSSNSFNTTLTNEGASQVKPIVVSGAIIYVSLDGKRIIMLTNDGKTTDLTTLFSDYLYLNSTYGYSDYVKKIVANESTGIIYALSNEGKLFGLRLNTLQSKWGIFQIETNLLVESAGIAVADICVAYENQKPTLFLYTFYTDTDNVKQHAVFKQRFQLDYSGKSRDAGLFDAWQANGLIAGKVVTLPTHLRKGRYTLGVYYKANDGLWYYEQFATGYDSTVTLSRDADLYTDASCGFVYTQRIKSLDLDLGGSSGGTGITLIKRIDELNFKVWNSDSFQFGVEGEDLEEVVVSSVTSDSFYTGTVSKKLQSSPERENHVIIQNTNPTPLYISSVVYRGLTAE